MRPKPENTSIARDTFRKFKMDWYLLIWAVAAISWIISIFLQFEVDYLKITLHGSITVRFPMLLTCLNKNAQALICASASCPHCQYLWHNDIMSWLFAASYDAIFNHELILHRSTSETLKTRFFKCATGTFDLWPWWSNSSNTFLRYTPPPNFEPVRQMMNGLTDLHTHRHTYRHGWKILGF